ncbi:uncharacterized protein LOC106731726 isoform X3 [Pelodiscus sinensis]|uniref:uncharacterized protein LOC106731726 isoform X3 n=1 Tax=Pelodiscus sinensis TaxID=13735 RepID=UPI003F6D5673
MVWQVTDNREDIDLIALGTGLETIWFWRKGRGYSSFCPNWHAESGSRGIILGSKTSITTSSIVMGELDLLHLLFLDIWIHLNIDPVPSTLAYKGIGAIDPQKNQLGTIQVRSKKNPKPSLMWPPTETPHFSATSTSRGKGKQQGRLRFRASQRSAYGCLPLQYCSNKLPLATCCLNTMQSEGSFSSTVPILWELMKNFSLCTHSTPLMLL